MLASSGVRNQACWLTVGWVIALIVQLLDVVLLAVVELDLRRGGLIGGLALARLL